MIKPRTAVIEMSPYHPPTEGRAGLLRMDFNENTVGCSPKVIRALRSIRRETLATYPEYETFKEELANYFKVSADEVVPTNGTDEAIKTVVEVFIEKGKNEMVLPSPTYTMFTFYGQLNEARLRIVPYKDDLSFPTDRAMRAINQKTKIVVLVNPNNPTGTSISRRDIVKIVEKARKSKALVLIDEAYFQFFDSTAIPLIKKYDNVIVIQTFSKAFGLAGLRLGCILSNPETISVLKKALSPYSVNTLATVAATAALRDKEYVARYVSEVKKSKAMFYRALWRLGISSYPSDANFVLVRIGKSAKLFCQRMKDKGILVRNRSSDLLLDGYVRITMGTVKQTRRLIAALHEVMKDIRPVLIFDMDGVLVDVSASYRVAIKETSEEFTGSPVSFEEIQSLKERGGYNNDWDLTMAIIKSRGITKKRDAVVAAFQKRYLKLMRTERWLFDKALLGNLSERYRLAIFTGRPRKEAFFVLKNNGVQRFFDRIVAMKDVKKQKPDPEGIITLLSGYRATEAYYFGDSVDDVTSAIRAKVIPIGVLPPQKKIEPLRRRLAETGAKRVISTINEIQKVLP